MPAAVNDQKSSKIEKLAVKKRKRIDGTAVCGIEVDKQINENKPEKIQGPVKIQCSFGTKSKLHGVCVIMTKNDEKQSLSLKKIIPRYVGLDAWKEKVTHDTLSKCTHFLPLDPVSSLTKAEMKL